MYSTKFSFWLSGLGALVALLAAMLFLSSAFAADVAVSSFASDLQVSPSVIGRGEVFTMTSSIRNVSAETKVFTNTLIINYGPTDGGLLPFASTGQVYMEGNQVQMKYIWTGELGDGQAATITVVSHAGQTPGLYDGAFMMIDPEGNIIARNIVVLKSKPEITSITPQNAAPGERVTIAGKNFLTDVPPGTSAGVLLVSFVDPITNGVNSIDGKTEGMLWEDESISFILPHNIKQDYVYSVQIFRGQAFEFSNVVAYETGRAPSLVFGLDVNPNQVASGGLITATLQISNAAAITQSSLTTFTIGSGIAEVLGYEGPGDVYGLGAVNDVGGLSMTDMRWIVNLPPRQSAVLQIKLIANNVDVQTEFPGFLTWEVNEDVLIGSTTISPLMGPPPVVRIDSVPAEVTQGQFACVRGEFPKQIGIVVLEFDEEGRTLNNVIILQPDVWNTTQVCFNTTMLPLVRFRLQVMAGSTLSNVLNFRVLNPNSLIYLPLIVH